MNTTANIYLLKTNNIGSSLTLYHDGSFNNCELSTNTNKLQYHTNHEIYITLPQSDLEISKIKEGDYVVIKLGENTKVTNVISINGKNPVFSIEIEEGYTEIESLEKIVACTDTSLKYHTIENFGLGATMDKYSNLPSIPKTFIDFFISEYNVISQVEVELDECETHLNDACNVRFECCGEPIKLKLNQNNEVVVVLPELDNLGTISKPVFNLETVKSYIKRLEPDFQEALNELFYTKFTKEQKTYLFSDLKTDLEILIKQNEDDFDRGRGKHILNNWIKENL